MAHPTYEPLPLTHEGDHAPTQLYNAPPTSHTRTTWAFQWLQPNPAFWDAPFMTDGPVNRDSMASSSHSAYPSGDRASAYTTDSAHGLNEGGTAPRGGYGDSASTSYHDEPGFFVYNGQPRRRDEKRATYANPKSRRRPILIVAVAVAVALTTHKKSKSDSSSSSSSDSDTASNGGSDSSSSSSPQVKAAIVTGTDGSTITADDGSTFTYTNSFQGSWYWDANDPFNNGAQAQSCVNLGGWLVTEPFIVPDLYQTMQNRSTTSGTIIDEWTLVEAMQADTANGGISQLENHYKTFITEQDFMQIAAAGLNFVRITSRSFLPNTSWTYFLKAIQWARKYGIRINLDLHALPGSQNGWNHSGRLGTYNVIYGPMGIANAQVASLDYVRIITEFISQPEYSSVVVMFGVTNEPQGNAIGLDNVRLASGTGSGNGPLISYHDGFIGLSQWGGYLPGADRVSLDSHPYLCFSGQSASPITTYNNAPCNAWGSEFNNTMEDFGFIVAGEFSNAVTDCGTYVNGVGQGTRYEGTFAGSWPVMGDCESDWLNWQTWNSATKNAYKTFAQQSMDALQNWFFWTWKIANTTNGVVEAPQWSYSLGLQNGWMPTDPRSAIGACGNTSPFLGTLSSWQTGGAGAGTIPASVTASLSWPPVVSASLLPTYTPQGTPITLPGPTFTTTSGGSTPTASINVGSGWLNSADTAGMMKPIAGCSYLDPWIGSTVSPPAPLCTGQAARAVTVDEPAITPAP
ncbi:glycoside hydrolase [Roridomyces roridus]|uniref:glucan 1,3-beta-glucosidase n=1 Tax=Roridomyces roridus TaxID=1738132 RepID=A0AAD7BVZ1_9AGAR|nr:glycoside hydrolase [Roridomyces roridus]